ncbi:hypothetical protein VTI74DRAFT_972 [Chaetomium olivicolor]
MSPLQENIIPDVPPPVYSEEDAAAPAPTAAVDEPPAYREAQEVDPDEVVQPCMLLLRGRYIYSESSKPTPDVATAATTITTTDDSTLFSDPPSKLYRLSRAIHTPGRDTDSIDFQRLDSHYGARTTLRPRHLYTLDYGAPVVFIGHMLPPQLMVVPQASRKVTLGAAQIVRSGLLSSEYRALKILSEKDRRTVEKEGTTVKKGEYWFAINGGGEAWQWSDHAGRRVADQVCERSGTEGAEDEYKLHVLVPLPRRVLDALVAMWCLWMWQAHIKKNTPKRTWEDRKRIMSQPRRGPRLYGGPAYEGF